MNKAYLISDNIISSLGFSSRENLENLQKGKSGITQVDFPGFSPNPVFVSAIDTARLENTFHLLETSVEFSRLEKMLLLSISDAVKNSNVHTSDPKCLFILSTTKGNIEAVDENAPQEFFPEIGKMAEKISTWFKNPNKPVVISNACTSGLVAILAGMRAIQTGKYDHVIVSGGDVLSAFVLSGFQCLMAISPAPCKPYDATRNGITMGEACGTIVLSKIPKTDSDIFISGGSTSNDANHISGPSRTGSGLILAIEGAMKEAKIKDSLDIGFISAHGTGTIYNDEMEAIAFHQTGLSSVPVNSLKGFWGHTLGAAGIIETIATIHSLKNNFLIPSAGYSHSGVSVPVNVIRKFERIPLTKALKTASGFGGCNAAAIFEKHG